MPAPYEVSPKRLQQIFDKRITKLLFKDIEPVAPGERPTLTLLGGQTAAGKSSALNGIADRHGNDIAQINPDDFRLFHPELDEIMREAPHEMTDHTAQAMYAWSDMARAYAHAHGYRLIIENTFSRPEYLSAYAHELSEPVYETREDGTEVQVHSGYEVEVVALATPTERSCLDMVGRYLNEPVEEARWSDAEYHDSVVAQLPQSLETVEADPHVDRVIITDRSGAVHYDNARGLDGVWTHEPRAAQALREARGDGHVVFTQDEARDWLSKYWQHSQTLLERGELDDRTAPTMRVLHEHADRVAQVAYADNADQLAQHEQWQKAQKVVFMAGERGAANAELPHHPEEFFNADAEKKAQFVATLRAAGKTTPSLPKDAVDAVKRAQQGVAPPTIRASPSSESPASSQHHQGRGKGPDIER